MWAVEDRVCGETFMLDEEEYPPRGPVTVRLLCNAHGFAYLVARGQDGVRIGDKRFVSEMMNCSLWERGGSLCKSKCQAGGPRSGDGYGTCRT